jgi:hypothetical protein
LPPYIELKRSRFSALGVSQADGAKAMSKPRMILDGLSGTEVVRTDASALADDRRLKAVFDVQADH